MRSYCYYCFMGTEFRASVWGDKKVLEMDGGNGQQYECTECHRTVHIKVVKRVSFMLCVLLQKKYIGVCSAILCGCYLG